MRDQSTHEKEREGAARADAAPGDAAGERTIDEMIGEVSSEQQAPQQAELPAGELDEALAARDKEIAELKDRLLRTLADMENQRRRSERDVEEARKYATTGFARGILEVADNLSRALSSVPVEERERTELLKNLVVGVEMTEKTLLSVLEKHNIKKVSPQPGEKFDHNHHQAMFEVESAEHGPGQVVDVLQPGYVIADRLLRPAMVGVAKAKRPQDDAPSGA